MRFGQKDGLHWTAFGSPLAKRYALYYTDLKYQIKSEQF